MESVVPWPCGGGTRVPGMRQGAGATPSRMPAGTQDRDEGTAAARALRACGIGERGAGDRRGATALLDATTIREDESWLG